MTMLLILQADRDSITVQIPPTVYRWIEEQARRQGTPMTQYILEVIELGLIAEEGRA